jgi:DNA-binding NarL/FixJ family response regulator
VLKRIARGSSNKEIASQMLVSMKTVETYKARAMKKLGIRRRVDVVRYAIRQGWLSDSETAG